MEDWFWIVVEAAIEETFRGSMPGGDGVVMVRKSHRHAHALRALDLHLLRPNELRALQRKNVNFSTGLISVENAWDFENDKPKAYPKSDAGVRKVPIEPEIEFMLRQLCQGLSADDYLIPNLPPKEDWAATLRVHLRRAGVDR